MSSSLVGNTHLIAGTAAIVPALLIFLKKEGIPTNSNPDLYVRHYANFGIDDARELKQRASTKAVSQYPRVFILAMQSITSEAQNALLKTIEEPAGNTMFFFVVPSPLSLLATVRSRSQILSLKSTDGTEHSGDIDAKNFLTASPATRLEMLKPLLQKDADDRRDTGAILTFLSSIEATLSKGDFKQQKDGLKAVYRARRYITDKGALIKPLLEQVALLSPSTFKD